MLALDCEFDGHDGPLISMAIVGPNDSEFYEVLPHWSMTKDPWVQANVLPVLNKQPIESWELFREKLWAFLAKHIGYVIVADSPADFKYLMENCHFMSNERYAYINLWIKMHFIITGKYISKIPHNALEDARALREYLANEPASSFWSTHVVD